MTRHSIMGFDPSEELEKNKNTPTFKEFIQDQYIPYVQAHKRSWDQDQKMLELRVLSLWGSKKISEITREDVQQFQSNFLKAGCKPATANRYMGLVKYIFNLAEKCG